MYEFLTKLFEKNEDGTTKPMTAEELTAAIEADKSIKLVNLSDGGYIAKDKHDKAIKDKDDEIAAAKASLDDANKAIQSYKGMDIEGIKKSVEDWEAKYEADTKALNEQIEANRKAYAEELLLANYEFTSKAARNGILSEIRSKDFKLDSDGTLLGAKELIEKLQTDDDYKGAFVVAETSDEGNGGNDGGDAGNQNGGNTPPRFTSTNGNGGQGNAGGGQKMSLSEAMAYKNAHPDADVANLLG